jgi:hypothetical protein
MEKIGHKAGITNFWLKKGVNWVGGVVARLLAKRME